MEFQRYETVTACTACGSEQLVIINSRAAIHECTHCKCRIVSPRPTQASITLSYNVGTVYEQWLKDDEKRTDLWKRRLAIIRTITNKGTILDVGAGIGTFLHLAKQEGYIANGTETSETATHIAQKLYGLSLACGQLADIHYTDASFDIVTMWHVLEHVPMPSQIIKECFRILKPGGHLVIAVPNDLELKGIIGECIGRSRYKPITFCDEIHLTYFTTKSLNTALIKSGFNVIQNGLDDYSPVKNIKRRVKYFMSYFIELLTGVNIYDTLFAIGKKGNENLP